MTLVNMLELGIVHPEAFDKPECHAHVTLPRLDLALTSSPLIC